MNRSAESIRRFLACHSETLFASISNASLDDLLATAEAITVPSEATFISQGEAGDAFYLILSGQVRVFTVSEEGLKTVLNRLGPGEGIGEMSLLTDQPRSILFGRPGTEVVSAAACLHAKSGAAEGPFLKMDAKTATLAFAWLFAG